MASNRSKGKGRRSRKPDRGTGNGANRWRKRQKSTTKRLSNK